MVHYGVMIFSVNEDVDPELIYVDVYGSDENACGSVYVRPAYEERAATVRQLRHWADNDTPLILRYVDGYVQFEELDVSE